MHCAVPLTVDTLKGNYSLPRKIESKIKSPVASPLASTSLKQVVTSGIIRIPSHMEEETATSITPPTSEQLYERGLFRRLSSGTILASPTVSAMKKAIDRSSSPSRATVDLNDPKGRLRSRDASPGRTVRLPIISSPASTVRLERKEERESSPIREARQIVRTGGLVVTPQVSPLKMFLKSKSVSKINSPTISSPAGCRLSPLRRRGFSEGEESLDPQCEASMSYRRTPEVANEVEMEWDHLTKSFVPSLRK